MAAEGAWLRPSAEEAQRPPWPGAKGPRGLGNEEKITEGPGGQCGPFAHCVIDALLPSMGAAARRQTTGGCPAISGATPILSVLSAHGWLSCLY